MFVKFVVDTEGTVATGYGHKNPATVSLKTMLEAVNNAVAANPAAYTDVQMNALQTLVNTYSTYMTDWTLDSITAWTQEETE